MKWVFFLSGLSIAEFFLSGIVNPWQDIAFWTMHLIEKKYPMSGSAVENYPVPRFLWPGESYMCSIDSDSCWNELIESTRMISKFPLIDYISEIDVNKDIIR